MMKRIVISLGLILFLLACQAQDIKKGSLEFSLGPAFPFGEFSYKQIRDAESGYAENGISLATSFIYRLKRQFGLVTMISVNISGLDETSIAHKYWQPEFGYDWTLEPSHWISTAYLTGFDIILPMLRSDFNFRLLGGFATTRLPGLSGSAYNFHREASKDNAVAWSAGAGFTYQSFKKVTLSFRMDFFQTYPVLDEVWTSDIGPSGKGKIFQKIGILKLTAGFGFRIF
jgi:hypothetical protein